MFELGVIATWWATAIGVLVSAYATYVYHPEEGPHMCFQQESKTFFTTNFDVLTTLDFIKVIFYALTCSLIGVALYRRKDYIYRIFKRAFRCCGGNEDSNNNAAGSTSTTSKSFCGSVLETSVLLFKTFFFIEIPNSVTTLRTGYWEKFFDKWIVVSLIQVIVAPFFSRGGDLEVSTYANFYWVFKAYAILSLLQAIYENLSMRNRVISERWESTRGLCQIVIFVSLIVSIISLSFYFRNYNGSNFSHDNKHHIADLGLCICRLCLGLMLIYCFVDLILTIQLNYRDLLNSVLQNEYIKGSVLSDDCFYCNNLNTNLKDAPQEGNTSPSGGDNGEGKSNTNDSLLSHKSTKDHNDGDKSKLEQGVKDISETNNNYTMVYFEISKLIDLVKMISVILLIDVYNTINLVFIMEINHFIGNELLFVGLYYLGIGIPLLYSIIIGWTHKNSINAVDIARDACIKAFYLFILFFFSLLGTNYACTLVSALRNTDNSGRFYQGKFIFFDYFNRAMIYQSIFSFTLSFLTSPGARLWYQLSKRIVVQIVLLPFIWPPPFTVARLHEVSGENFVLTSLWHTLCWIFFFSFGYFDIKKFLLPTITGFFMLLMCWKLVWPPGKPLPFAQALGIGRLESFLKDSKYGSYHVYLAIGLLALYCIHSSFLYKYVAFPYFVLPLLAWFALRLIHSSTRQFWRNLILGQSNALLYRIRSTSRIPLRGIENGKGGRNSTFAVTLSVTPPSNIPFLNFEGSSCDLIMLRNTSNFQNANIECVHYFSVVSIQPIEDEEDPRIDVTLLIQVTARPDGITSLLTKEDYEEDIGSNKASKLSIENCGFKMAGLVKSSSLEALHSPCIVAFAFDSGSAAFCSLFRQRSKTREIIDRRDGGKVVFHDLCVVWVSFIVQRVKGEVQGTHVAKAVQDLCTLQHYLYQKSGGRGTKFLFVVTGVPPEWTPAPECPSHKTRGVEEDVAKLLSVDKDKTRPDEWLTEERVIDRDLFRFSKLSMPHNFQDFVQMMKASKIPSRDGSMMELRGTGELIPNRSNLNNPLLSSSISNNSINSNTANSSMFSPYPNNSINRGSKFGGLTTIRISTDSVKEVSNQDSGRCSEFLETPEERASVFLQIQAKEESWVPLRHALASKWNVFQGCLEFRVHSLFNWLYSPGGPDYTTLFITEHQSDVGIFRDFRYQDVYNEINRCILENQLRYRKNPTEFLDGKTQTNGDPLTCDMVSCSVLYSGDFQSNKKDNLGSMVKEVSKAQLDQTFTPATLSFVPDG